jgi:hypothetical protein
VELDIRSSQYWFSHVVYDVKGPGLGGKGVKVSKRILLLVLVVSRVSLFVISLSCWIIGVRSSDDKFQ